MELCPVSNVPETGFVSQSVMDCNCLIVLLHYIHLYFPGNFAFAVVAFTWGCIWRTSNCCHHLAVRSYILYWKVTLNRDDCAAVLHLSVAINCIFRTVKESIFGCWVVPTFLWAMYLKQGLCVTVGDGLQLSDSDAALYTPTFPGNLHWHFTVAFGGQAIEGGVHP